LFVAKSDEYQTVVIRFCFVNISDICLLLTPVTRRHIGLSVEFSLDQLLAEAVAPV